MKLEKANVKAFLYNLMLVKDGKQRQFPIGQLADAASAAKKLLEGTLSEGTSIQFMAYEVEFSAEEWVLLKGIFREVDSASIRDAEVIAELTEAFA